MAIQRRGKSAARTPTPTPAPLRGAFVTDRLVEDLRRQVRSGKLKPGDPVRPVRELSKLYQISYNSVRRALMQLAAEGLLSLEQGRGTFVTGSVEAAPTAYRQASLLDPAPHSEAPASKTKNEAPSVVPAVPAAARATPVANPIFSPALGCETPPAPPALPSLPDEAPGKLGLSEVRPLAGRRSIAVLLAVAPASLETRPDWRKILRGVRRCVLENGDVLSLLGAHPRKPLPTPNECRAAGFEGVLLLGEWERERLAGFAESPLPCVLLDHWPDTLPLNGVLADNFSGAYLLAKQLLNAGHREIVFVSAAGPDGPAGAGTASSNMREREAGGRLALKEEGLELRAERTVLEHPETSPSTRAWAKRLCARKPRPTAIFAASEVTARAVLTQLERLGKKVPEDFSVVCFGAQPAPGGQGALRFTAARVDYAKMGEAGVGRLRQRMGGAPPSRLRVNIPVEIVPGQSVASVPRE